MSMGYRIALVRNPVVRTHWIPRGFMPLPDRGRA